MPTKCSFDDLTSCLCKAQVSKGPLTCYIHAEQKTEAVGLEAVMGLEWAADDQALLYTTSDQAGRPYKVWLLGSCCI